MSFAYDPYDDGLPIIEDGDGNWWSLCDDRCDLEVVAPGRVQCGGAFCSDLGGYETWAEKVMDY